MKFNKNFHIISLCLVYILTAGGLYYFGKTNEWLLPLYLLIALWSVPFLILSIVFKKILNPEKKASTLLMAGVFAILQAGIGFAIGHYMFNLSLLTASSFALGAILAYVALMISYVAKSENGWAPLVLAALITIGVALALRLDGILTSFAFALAWLNTLFIGFKSSENTQKLWARACHGMAVLVIARAAIQYYLMQSNYDVLGVVISHPYSFVALFAGIAAPVVYFQIQKNHLMPSILALILLGILVPGILGVFIHTRPVAGYLLGLTVSAFIVGLLLTQSFKVFLLAYLNLITSTLALPLFNEYSNLTRQTRLYLLAGLIVFLVLIFLINTWLMRRPAEGISENPA